MAHVAAEFPQLCEAETRAFERLLGTHVQRLATIARGDAVCTTYIPGAPDPHTRFREDASMTLTQDEQIEQLSRYKFGWADADVAGAAAKRGLSEEVVRDISAKKSEPEWMLELRLKGLRAVRAQAAADLGRRPGRHRLRQHQVLRPLDREAGRQLGRAARGHQGDVRPARHPGGGEAAAGLRRGRAVRVRGRLPPDPRRTWSSRASSSWTPTPALREQPELFREYFGTVIPVGDNKFASLNTAVWSGGSFIYVPKGVHVDIPLQAYFRINTENMGQFERTLIIVDEDAYVHYVEGCTAPIYSSDSLHSAVVEIIVKKGGRCRYTTIQNWSNNVYNLVTKRALAHEGATMEWVDGNIGSKVTMKYPAVWMVGEHAKGEVLSIAFSGEGQHQDAGAKMVHAAPNTSSTIISKSVARGGGRTSYRGLVQVNEGAHGSRSTVKCDALLVDAISRSDTYPYVDVREDDVSMGHEATVSKVSEEQLFYLMSRGLTEDEAMAMIVRGFVEPIARELPMEYALELNRLIELQMEGAVG